MEDSEVDIMTCDKIIAYVSSDEEEEEKGCLLYLPIAPEVEEPEDSQLNLVRLLSSCHPLVVLVE